MKRLFIGMLILVVLAGAGFVAYKYVPFSGVSQSATVFGALTKQYENSTYKFRLMMPEDFTATETSDDNANTILLQNSKGEGIQIRISALAEDMRELTKERVEADIPDMKITNVESLEVGNDFKGLAFRSDNEAFDGASREVWFPFVGNFYQISTYERFDPLLKSIFSTWQFF